MKRETKLRLLSDFWNWLLAMAITVSTVGCMSSTFWLTPDSWFDLIAAWGLTAFVCCLCARIRRGYLILLLAALFAALLFWYDGTLLDHVEVLLYRISAVYDRSYRCGTLPVPENIYSFEMGLGLIGCLCAAVCSACLCAGTGTLLCTIIGLLPLAPCLALINTAPDEGCLFMLLTSLLILLITSAVRRRDRKDGLRLGALMLIPAIVFVSLTIQIAPSASFRNTLSALQSTVLSWFDPIEGGVNIVAPPAGGDRLYTEITDLSSLGPQQRQYAHVMDITSTYSDVLYLRGQAYDSYTGKSWAVGGDPFLHAHDWPVEESRKELGSISIKTVAYHPLRYFPYYPAGSAWQSDFFKGHLINKATAHTYSFSVTELDPAYTTNAAPPIVDANPYLQLPEYTLLAARAYLDGYGLSAKTSQRELAQAICKLVSESAQYSLDTPKMPADERDFAIWFLRESDTGYCVHFATAAVVLLRASGIEARYVTGYAQTVQADATVPVYAHHAHAWVEYFDTAAGCWRYLDPTPATAGSTNPNAGTNTDEPQPSDDPTQPPETEPVETSPGSAPTDGNDAPSAAPTLPTATTGGAEPPTQVTVTQKVDALWILLPIGLAAIVAGQYFLRLLLYRRRLRHGKPNARALLLWHQVTRYALALKRRPPKELLELAEKARFSQHCLTEQELAQFAQHLAEVRAELKVRKFPIRIFWQLVLALE